MTTTAPLNLEEQLLKKIEITKISRQLKSKLMEIKQSSSGASTEISHHHKPYTYSVPKRIRRYGSSNSDFSQIESPTKHYKVRKHNQSYSSPLRIATPNMASRSKFSSPTSDRGTPLRNRKYFRYESLNDMVESEPRIKPNNSVLRTPKAKITRIRSLEGKNDDEGANLLMFLATSPSYKKDNARANSNNNNNNLAVNQFMSSPVRSSKRSNDFLDYPSTPHLQKSHSSPFAESKNAGFTTPKMSQNGFNSNNPTVFRTPKFNMSDYVNFMSPSPCAKKSNRVAREDVEVKEKAKDTKDEETEEEEIHDSEVETEEEASE